MKQSAGTLLYRQGDQGLEVLIVHQASPFPQAQIWTIPKGVVEKGEDPETVARRETQEEAGITVTGPLESLGTIEYQKSPKRIECYAGPAPRGADPKPDPWETDEARFVSLEEAKELLHPDQRVFVDRLRERLRGS